MNKHRITLSLLSCILAVAGCAAPTTSSSGSGNDPGSSKHGDAGDRASSPPPPRCEAVPEVTAAASITIRGEALADVDLVAEGGLEGATTQAGADGRFAIEIPLKPNQRNVLRIHASIDGSVGEPCVAEVVHDDRCPGAPLLDPLPSITARAEVTVRGTTEPMARVRLSSSVDSVETTADASGRFEAALGLADAGASAEVILATSIDAAGNECAPAEAQIDVDATVDLDAPIVDPVESPTAEASIDLRGRVDAGARVRITGGVSPVEVTADATGRFHASVELFRDREHTLTLAAIDASGRASANVGVRIVQDSTAPSAPSCDAMPDRTSRTRIDVHGRAEAFARVEVDASAGTFDTRADASGSFSLSVDLAAETMNTLRIRAIDAAGNASAEGRFEVEHSSTAPTVELDALATLTAETTIRVRGTASAGADVRITGGASPASCTADASGRFSASVRLQLDARNALLVTDVSTGASARLVITHDGTAPDAPLLDATAAVTASASVHLTGTAEAGARIEVRGGASIASTTAGSDGRFALDVALHADATASLSIIALDACGNASAATSVTIEHDASLLAAPICDTSAPAATASLTFHLRGHLDAYGPDSYVEIRGGASLAIATVDAATGAFSADVTLRANALNELELIAVHADGSISAASHVTLTHDDIAPAAPLLGDLSLDLGLSLCPARLSVSLHGSAAVEAGARVRVTNEATGATSETWADATGSFALDVGACLGDPLTVVAIDAAANVSAATSLTAG